jgi:hypothetical protein
LNKEQGNSSEKAFAEPSVIAGSQTWYWDYIAPMEISEAVQCPFCGQSIQITVDTSAGNQVFVADCEVCCRPMQITAECTTGEILSLSAEPG